MKTNDLPVATLPISTPRGPKPSPARLHPRILWIEPGALSIVDTADGSRTQLQAPPQGSRWSSRWWHKIEALLRLDLALAFQAKHADSVCDYDIAWAASEKVGIPLSFMHLHKPLVVIAHHMSSPLKAKFARAAKVVDHWAGIGYISDEGRDFIINYFGIPPHRLFQYEDAEYLDRYCIDDIGWDGPIMSVGVAKRDYNTLLAALAGLPECTTELYISSRFGDQLRSQTHVPVPQWVKIMGWTSEQELVHRYHRTRFAVVPLVNTTHSGAGISAVLEASALGKAVIATRTGGMATFVKDGETGILVPPYDVQAWRRAIQQLCEQPELAQRMGEAGRRYMQERFHPEVVRTQLDAFLDDLHAQQYCSKI